MLATSVKIKLPLPVLVILLAPTICSDIVNEVPSTSKIEAAARVVIPLNEEVPVDALSVPLNARASAVEYAMLARSNTAPLATEVPAAVVPRALLVLTFNVPPATAVAPEYVLFPVNVNAPSLTVNAPVPEITPSND